MTRARLIQAIGIPLATLLLSSVAVRGASIDCNRAIAVPGGVALLEVSLTTEPGEGVQGTQNELLFDDNLFDVSRQDCRINPDIGPSSDAGKNLSRGVLPDPPPRLRAFVLALDNLNVIPDGLLYTCDFHTSPDAPFEEITIFNTNLGVAPLGDVNGTDCLIDIVSPTPTATETPPCVDELDCPLGEVCVDGTCFAPTPTPTPIGFCREDGDCDPAEICADDTCTLTTPTPSATPVGDCRDDRDCQGGEVCVDDRCTPLPPTPTPSATPVGFCRDSGDCQLGEVCIDEICRSFTPTITPTPSATPVGFCRDSGDCQLGDVCVGNECIERTPTPSPRTPTSPPVSTATATRTHTPEGFCVEDGDCPVGQACEGNSCVAAEKEGYDDGCQINPTSPGDGRAVPFAWLIPALLLLARWRAERSRFARRADPQPQS